MKKPSSFDRALLELKKARERVDEMPVILGKGEMLARIDALLGDIDTVARLAAELAASSDTLPEDIRDLIAMHGEHAAGIATAGATIMMHGMTASANRLCDHAEGKDHEILPGVISAAGMGFIGKLLQTLH